MPIETGPEDGSPILQITILGTPDKGPCTQQLNTLITFVQLKSSIGNRKILGSK